MIIEVFGKVLRMYREKNNLSQEKLAEYCDLHPTYISMLERGYRQPTITTIFKLAKALKIQPSELIGKVEQLVKE